MQPLVDEDATNGQPIFRVAPDENVYSYFMFIGPTEKKRRKMRMPASTHNDINWDLVLGYVLVIANFIMQSVLLYLIFETVVLDNIEWQNGIMKLGGGGGAMALLTDRAECNDGGSLCFREKGQYSCAPPSVQITGRWSELDTDNDGVWTREEAIAKRKELQCKYVVDPVVVYDVLLDLLKERENLLWLHPLVKNASHIHLPYFTYIMADVIMCSYRSVDMCSNLLQRGYFHAPLKYNTAPRVGNTIDTALRYCHKLLAPGGMCERHLPSTYTVWKTQSTVECGEPAYTAFKYQHPRTGAKKSLLAVDYVARQEYETAQDVWFQLFKAVVVFLWLLLMSSEIKDVVKFLTLCGRMPNAHDFGEEAVIMEQDPSDPEDVRFRIQGLETHHRYSMIVVNVIRTLLTVFLAVVGVSYLVKTNDFVDLIMNGVSLAFIGGISCILWAQALRNEIKDQTEDIKPIKVEMYGWDWLNSRPALIDIMVVFVICVIVYYLMDWQTTSIVVPVHDALQCTCISEGELCVEAQKYNYDFWHEYWLNGVPGVFEAVADLKASVLGSATGGAPAAASAAAPAAASAFLDMGTITEVALDRRKDRLKRRLAALADRFEAFQRSESPSTGASKIASAHLAVEMGESIREVETQVSRGFRHAHEQGHLKA